MNEKEVFLHTPVYYRKGVFTVSLILFIVLGFFSQLWSFAYFLLCYILFGLLSPRILLFVAHQIHLNIDKSIRCLEGQQKVLNLIVENHSVLLLDSCTITLSTKEGIAWESSNIRETNLLKKHVRLKKREKSILPCKFQANKLGKYTLSTATISLSDPFGIFQVSIVYHLPPRHIVVYPTLLQDSFTLPETHYFGERSSKNSPFLDETTLIGVKTYEHEPQKYIYWPGVAKTGTLQAKVFARASLHEYIVILDLMSKDGYAIRRDYEYLISVTATLINHLTEKGYRFGLFVNRFNIKHGVTFLPLGEGRKHYWNALEILSSLKEEDQWVQSVIFQKIIQRHSISAYARKIYVTEWCQYEMRKPS
jgi:uncharacterized protein (DUF58 family)